MMTFDEVLEGIIQLLQREKRVSYRALKRRFDLDDEYIEDLKVELIEAKRLAIDENDRILVWTGEADTTPESAFPQPAKPEITAQTRTTTAELPPPTESFSDAERRQLTVMFCDLADSTRLSGQLDPEDLRDVIRAYQSSSAEVIERYGGYIAQHLGDGLMVYFGWPQAHEDDAQRAVHAGLGILKAMEELNALLEQAKGIRLAVRMGVHTGLVVVGEIGTGERIDHLAVGEPPNIASRIQGIAAPDSVAISQSTHQLVRGYFALDELGARTLKGVADPMAVYRVVGEHETQSRFEMDTTRGPTPFVGREDDVALLQRRWAQSRNGQGQVVLLSGEAGIGKSRLVARLHEQVIGDGSPRITFRCSPYHTNSPLFPVIEHVQRLLQWQTVDRPQEKLHKLEQVLQSYGFTLDETIPLFAPLLSLPLPEDRYPDLGLSPQRQRQLTLDDLVTWFLKEAERQPVLVLWEDLHWADPSTLELLSLLLDQVATARMLTLMTFRPDFTPQWAMGAHMTQITLNRLATQQIERIATHMAGGKQLPSDVTLHIVSATDGVPLFVEEVSREVLESGLLQEKEDHYQLTGSLTALSIPTTLQDALMARLDRLDEAKAVAQLGAVLGRSFPHAWIAAMSPLEDALLGQHLGELIRAGLLSQRGTPPQATYTFKHALVQDVAYQSLLKSTRQQYHQRFAQVLEESFPETLEAQPELLAYHYTEAGYNGPAVDAWRQAGELAVGRSANMEAISHLSKGLELLKALPETTERDHQELMMQMSLGPALMATEGYASPRVHQTYDRARTLCSQVGEMPQHTSVLMGLCRFYYAGGQMRPAREFGEHLLDLAQQNQDDAVIAVAQTALGTILCFMGVFTQACVHFEQVLAYEFQPQDQLIQARRWSTVPSVQSLVWHAYALHVMGYPDQSGDRTRQARALSQQLAHPHSEIYALYQNARLHVLRRELEKAHEELDALVPLATAHASTLWLAAGKFMQGIIHIARGHGEPERIVKEMEEQMAVVFATGADVFRPSLIVSLTDAYCAINQPDEGLRLFGEASAAIEKSGERFTESELYRIKGALLLAKSLDHEAEAESCLQQALSVARRQEAKSLELRAATSLARLWQSQGKHQDAHDLLQPVYGWFTEGFDTADLKEAKGLLDALS